jgi:hypothetical protein
MASDADPAGSLKAIVRPLWKRYLRGRLLTLRCYQRYARSTRRLKISSMYGQGRPG